MKKLIISMFVITAVVLTGCSSSSYPTASSYPERQVIIQDGYYPPGYYGPTYYGGGYYPPSRYYGAPYSRRRPTVIYHSAPRQRVIVTPHNNNWNRNNKNWNRSDNNNGRSNNYGNVRSRARRS